MVACGSILVVDFNVIVASLQPKPELYVYAGPVSPCTLYSKKSTAFLLIEPDEGINNYDVFLAVFLLECRK